MVSAYRTALLMIAAAAACATAACRSKTAGPVDAASTKAVGHQDHSGEGQKRHNNQAPLFVDGEFVVMLRFPELELLAPAREYALTDGGNYTHFSWDEIITGAGVPLAKLGALHLYGGGDNRVSIVDGKELRRLKGKLFVRFTKRTAGRAQMEWPDEKVQTNTLIDGVSAVAIYYKQKPPLWRAAEQMLEQGGKPFVLESLKVPHGVRVYQDGRLTQSLNRRDLIDLAGEEKPNLATLVAGLKIDGQNLTIISDDEALRPKPELWPTIAIIGQEQRGVMLQLPGHTGEVQLRVLAFGARPTSGPAANQK